MDSRPYPQFVSGAESIRSELSEAELRREAGFNIHLEGDGGTMTENANELDIALIVRQVMEQVSGQVADQVAQAVQQAARGVGAETSAATVETVVSPGNIAQAWAGNFKRTYDEFQDISLVSARRSQNDYDEVRAYSRLALQNAVNNADNLAKQAIAHRDIAIDREWNVNETDAYATILASRVAEILKQDGEA